MDLTSKPPERWKDVARHPHGVKYEISDSGIIRQKSDHKIANSWKTPTGALTVKLKNQGGGTSLAVHQLVAEAFIENPRKHKMVFHLDRDESNNQVENLFWCNYAEYNQLKKTKTKKIKKMSELAKLFDWAKPIQVHGSHGSPYLRISDYDKGTYKQTTVVVNTVFIQKFDGCYEGKSVFFSFAFDKRGVIIMCMNSPVTMPRHTFNASKQKMASISNVALVDQIRRHLAVPLTYDRYNLDFKKTREIEGCTLFELVFNPSDAYNQNIKAKFDDEKKNKNTNHKSKVEYETA